jgi:hypothetical protein
MDHAQRVPIGNDDAQRGDGSASAGGAEGEIAPGELLCARWRVAGTVGRVPGAVLLNALDERLRRRVRVLVPEHLDAARAGLEHPALPAPLAVERSGGRTHVAFPFWDGDLLALPKRPLADEREVRGFVHRAIGVLELLGELHHGGRAHGHLSLSSFWRTPDGTWLMLDAATTAAPDVRFAHPDDDPTDPRADLYAFAALLFAAATGTLPFGSGEGAAVAHRLFRLPETAVLPAPVLDVLRTALQKSPHHRFSSAGRMIAAFQQALAALDGQAPDPREAPERVPVSWSVPGAEPTMEPAPVRVRRVREPRGWAVLGLASLAFLSLFAWAGLAGLVVAARHLF